MKATPSTRSIALLVGLVAVATLAVVVALWQTWRMERLMHLLMDRNVEEMLAAVELRSGLQRQRGYVAAYLLDNGNPAWLRRLEAAEGGFEGFLRHLENVTVEPEELSLVEQVRRTFREFDAARDAVLEYHARGEAEGARMYFLSEVEPRYDAVAALSEQIVASNREDIQEAFVQSGRIVRVSSVLLLASALLTIALGAGLCLHLVHRVYRPLRSLASELETHAPAAVQAADETRGDDLANLAYYVRMLLAEVNEMRSLRPQNALDNGQAGRLAAIGEAVSHVAHEIKNRLCSIGLLARNIRKRAEHPQWVETDAAAIVQEIGRLERLLRDMMAYSQPTRFQARRQRLHPLLDDVARRFRNQLGKQVEVRLCLCDADPVLPLDRDRIEQVLFNLVGNAVEAMEGHGIVEIATLMEERSVVLEVRDTGPGIPPVVMQRLFEPFYTTKQRGNGLGLAICRQIVEEHGAEIEARSELGRGSCFRVVFKGAARTAQG